VSSSPQPLPPDLADALDALRPQLDPLANEVIYFESIGSTNDVASALAASGRHEGAVVIADAQTAGRGRRGRSRFSPPGAGLYVSTILAPARAGGNAGRATALLTLAAGVALSEAVERATGLAPAIKWPNDLLVDRRKLAGILAEGVTAPAVSTVQAVVLGYGINVAPAAYPPELASRVTSLEGELGRPIDRAHLCAESLAAIAARYRDLLAGRFDAILDAWRSRAFGSRGARVEWDTPQGVRSGITEDIDAMGALMVRSHTGVERIVAGEVRWDLHAASH
jgi:BirA family biotin operon repressor/biotin-[acetyl-CoA-carboxylase] ligase